jgi:hypothetical protein
VLHFLLHKVNRFCCCCRSCCCWCVLIMTISFFILSTSVPSSDIQDSLFYCGQ